MSSPAKSTSSHSFRMSDGDWICEDQNCQNINFARRVNCNICGKEKPIDSRLKDKESEKKRKIGHEIGKAAADKSKGLFSADDWQCGRCGNVNWARRTTCNMCSAPKFGDNEERTGLGGGYNERENVEYIQRQDSDDEWDDFGRKKKRSKRDDNNSSPDNSSKDRDLDSTHRKSDDSSEDEEEDDDNNADVSKYKLESDEEEEEDDDEEEGEDLSKYDLSECLEDKK